MSFTITKCYSDSTEIAGLLEIKPQVFGDARGYTFENFNQNTFAQAGLTMKFVQDNESCSAKGVLRGLHFQKRHPQGKLVRCISGKVFDVTVDLRNNSSTFGKWYGIILDSEKKNQIYIPEGFAHGFYVLSEYAVFSYKCTDFYHPEDEGGIMWNDPVLNIDWNSVSAGLTPLLSEKDKNHPLFNCKGKYFDINANWIGE